MHAYVCEGRLAHMYVVKCAYKAYIHACIRPAFINFMFPIASLHTNLPFYIDKNYCNQDSEI